MSDRSITDVEFGLDYLGGRSQKTARRRIIQDRIPYRVDHGHWLVKRSDAEAWRDSRMQIPPQPNLKSLVKEIADRVLRERKAKSAKRVSSRQAAEKEISIDER